jgi:drug/metabolite transporter (DMT)-like permease
MVRKTHDVDPVAMSVEKGTYGALEGPQGGVDPKPPVYLVHLALCTGYALFGGGAIVGKFGVHGSNPIMFELARESISVCLLFSAVCFMRQTLLPDRADAPRILLGGLSFFTNQIAWFVGLKLADPVSGSAWQAFLPIMTTGLSIAMGQAKIQAMQAIGIMIAAGGAILMVILDSTAEQALDRDGDRSWVTKFASHVIFFMGILGTSAYFLVNNNLGSKYSACATVMWSNMIGGTLLLFTQWLALVFPPLMNLLCYSDKPSLQAKCLAQGFSIPKDILPPLSYEVVICTLVAWPLLSWANQNTDPSVTTVYMGMHPVTSTTISAILVCMYGVEWGLRYDMGLPGCKDFGVLLIVCGLLITFRSEQAKRERTSSGMK